MKDDGTHTIEPSLREHERDCDCCKATNPTDQAPPLEQRKLKCYYCNGFRKNEGYSICEYCGQDKWINQEDHLTQAIFRIMEQWRTR